MVRQVSGEQLFDYHWMKNEHPGTLSKELFKGELFHFNIMDRRTVLLVFFCFLLITVRSEVQNDFSPECREFMYMGTPPRGLENRSLKKICQRYNGKPRYVTLYDVVDHIPVYSAYTFKRSDGFKKVDVPWMFEPQVTSCHFTQNE